MAPGRFQAVGYFLAGNRALGFLITTILTSCRRWTTHHLHHRFMAVPGLVIPNNTLDNSPCAEKILFFSAQGTIFS